MQVQKRTFLPSHEAKNGRFHTHHKRSVYIKLCINADNVSRDGRICASGNCASGVSTWWLASAKDARFGL
jgi:hypothetical protein